MDYKTRFWSKLHLNFYIKLPTNLFLKRINFIKLYKHHSVKNKHLYNTYKTSTQHCINLIQNFVFTVLACIWLAHLHELHKVQPMYMVHAWIRCHAERYNYVVLHVLRQAYMDIETENKINRALGHFCAHYRLNWARKTSWGWGDDWDDTVLQTQDSKFMPWRSEAEHATSRSRRLPTILTFTRGRGRNIFVSFKPPRPGTKPRTLTWKAAVPTTTLGSLTYNYVVLHVSRQAYMDIETENKINRALGHFCAHYRLNWARKTSWGWGDDWDDTVLQTQDSKFMPWRSEAEHATSRLRRLPTILTFTRGRGRNIFVSFKPPRPGTKPQTLTWKAAVPTTTLGSLTSRLKKMWQKGLNGVSDYDMWIVICIIYKEKVKRAHHALKPVWCIVVNHKWTLSK